MALVCASAIPCLPSHAAHGTGVRSGAEAGPGGPSSLRCAARGVQACLELTLPASTVDPSARGESCLRARSPHCRSPRRARCPWARAAASATTAGARRERISRSDVRSAKSGGTNLALADWRPAEVRRACHAHSSQLSPSPSVLGPPSPPRPLRRRAPSPPRHSHTHTSFRSSVRAPC